MPMNFPDMNSLKSTAEVHRFREPKDNETEANFRRALAKHVLSIDRVEAFEILFGTGWDLWSFDQQMISLKGII